MLVCRDIERGQDIGWEDISRRVHHLARPAMFPASKHIGPSCPTDPVHKARGF